MEKAGRRILKSSDVKFEGRVRLDVAQTGPSLAKGKSVASATPEARMVENRPEFAVIEITCSCGAKMCLRCEYAGAESSAESSQSQNGAVAESSQTQNGAVAGLDQKPD